MKLYIKQKIFSIGDKYDIFDGDGNVVYDVKSEIFTMMPKIHINDVYGTEQFLIKKKFTFMLAQYEVYKGDFICATIAQEFAFFKTKLKVDSAYGNFTIDGNFWSMDYEITKDGQYFGSIHKKWLSWGDSYELDIPNQEDAGFLCALVIAIDNCMHQENNN